MVLTKTRFYGYGEKTWSYGFEGKTQFMVNIYRKNLIFYYMVNVDV